MIMYLHIAKGSGRRLGDILRFEVSARYRYPILSQFFFHHDYALGVALPTSFECVRCINV